MNSQFHREQPVYCVQCGMPLPASAVECPVCRQPQPVPGAIQSASQMPRYSHSQQAFNIGVPPPWQVTERNTMDLQFTHIDRPDARAGGMAGLIQQALSTSPASLQIFLFSLPVGANVVMLNQAYTQMMSQKMAQRGGGMAGTMQLMAQPKQQQAIAFGDHPGLMLDFEHSFLGFGKTIERRFLTLTQMPRGVLGAVLVNQAPANEFARWEQDLWNIATSFRFGPAQETPQTNEIINHLPPLRVPEVNAALEWAWLVDLEQGNLTIARDAAREALSKQRNADTLFARAVVNQLQGNFKAAFPLFENAFNATSDPTRQVVIAAMARLAEWQRANILPDGFPLNFPEAHERFGEIIHSQWEQRWQKLNQQVEAPYASLTARHIHDGLAHLPELRAEAIRLVEGASGTRSLPQVQAEMAQWEQQAGQWRTPLIYLFSLVSQLEIIGLAGQVQAALDDLKRRVNYCQQTGAFLAAARFALLQGDLLASPAPLGHPILLGYRLSDSEMQITISADRTRFDRSAIDVAGAHSAYQIAWQNFDKAGAPRGKAMVRLRLAYLNAVEAINHQDRAKWTAAAQDYQEAKRHFTLLGDQVNSWAAAFGEVWTRLHLGEPRNQLIAEVTTLAKDLKENDALAWGLSWGLALAYAGREALALWGDVELALRAADLAKTVFGIFDTPRRQAQTCGDRADALQRLEATEASLVEFEAALEHLQTERFADALTAKTIGIQIAQKMTEIYSGQYNTPGLEHTLEKARSLVKDIPQVTLEEVQQPFMMAQGNPMALMQVMNTGDLQQKMKACSIRQVVHWIEEREAVYAPFSKGIQEMEVEHEAKAKEYFQEALAKAESCPDHDFLQGMIYTGWREREQALKSLHRYVSDGLPQSGPTNVIQMMQQLVGQVYNPTLAAQEINQQQISNRLPVVGLFIKNKAWPEAREQLTVIERVSGPLKPLDPVPTLAAIRNYFYYGLVATGHREYDTALGYLQEAVYGLEARRRALRQESLRRNFGGQYTTLQVYAEYTRLLAETGQWTEAFAIADLIRARVLSESLAGAQSLTV